jgi:hypothetical protein
MHSVNRILDHRVGPRGEIEYEVEWKEKKADGTPWPNDWLGAKDVTPDIIEQYNTKRGHGVPSRKAEIDISLLVPEVRLSLANVMMKGAPTRNGFNGPNRPRVHKLPLGCLCIESVARGFLDMMRKQGGPPIALDKGSGDSFFVAAVEIFCPPPRRWSRGGTPSVTPATRAPSSPSGSRLRSHFTLCRASDR